MLELDRASFTYPSGTGVHELTLRVRAGEIVALVGLNGAGKTTLLRLALGMLGNPRGQVRVFGKPVGSLALAAWGRVGYLLDAPLAYSELTTLENLRISSRLHHAGAVDPEMALQRWKLQTLAGKRYRYLSLGNKQRVGLAGATQHHPELVLLDEPSNALDPAGVIVLRELLEERRQAGAGVLVSSHHLDEVARIADRVVVMNSGRLIGELAPTSRDLERVLFDMLYLDDLTRARGEK